MEIEGGCHCGYITYAADADPENTVICHCADCQILSGSAFRTVAGGVADKDFRILSGTPTVYVKVAESGAEREQAFCPRCGSPIYSSAPGNINKIYNIRVGTIRQRDKFVPRGQIWCRSRQAWLAEIATVPSAPTQ